MLKLKIEGGVYNISFHKTNRLNSLIAESLREELFKIVSKAILAIVNRANEIGSRFRICNVSGEVYELLKLMKLKVTLEIDPVKAKEYVHAV